MELGIINSCLVIDVSIYGVYGIQINKYLNKSIRQNNQIHSLTCSIYTFSLKGGAETISPQDMIIDLLNYVLLNAILNGAMKPCPTFQNKTYIGESEALRISM